MVCTLHGEHGMIESEQDVHGVGFLKHGRWCRMTAILGTGFAGWFVTGQGCAFLFFACGGKDSTPNVNWFNCWNCHSTLCTLNTGT